MNHRVCTLLLVSRKASSKSPASMGEALVRLAGKLGMSAVAPEIEAMSDLQYAFVEGGCDRIVHWARSEYNAGHQAQQHPRRMKDPKIGPQPCLAGVQVHSPWHLDIYAWSCCSPRLDYFCVSSRKAETSCLRPSGLGAESVMSSSPHANQGKQGQKSGPSIGLRTQVTSPRLAGRVG